MLFNAPIVEDASVELVALEISLNVLLSVETCHWMLPVLPDKVIEVGVVAAHIPWLALTDPATLGTLTVSVAALLVILPLMTQWYL